MLGLFFVYFIIVNCCVIGFYPKGSNFGTYWLGIIAEHLMITQDLADAFFVIGLLISIMTEIVVIQRVSIGKSIIMAVIGAKTKDEIENATNKIAQYRTKLKFRRKKKLYLFRLLYNYLLCNWFGLWTMYNFWNNWY